MLQQINQQKTKKQLHITLDLGDPEPVKDLKPKEELVLGIDPSMEKIFRAKYPALFEKEARNGN